MSTAARVCAAAAHGMVHHLLEVAGPLAMACDDDSQAGKQLMSKDPELVHMLTFQDSGRSFFGVLAEAICEKRELERSAASVSTSAKGASEFTFGSQEEFER